jgi:hypothetical protein
MVRMRQCAKVVSNERYYSHVGQYGVAIEKGVEQKGLWGTAAE